MTFSLLLPPKSLTAMTDSIAKVDNKAFFFGRNLYIISDHCPLLQERVITDIVNNFLKFTSELEHSKANIDDLKKFKETFSSYCLRATLPHQINKQSNLSYLIECAQDLVKKRTKDFENKLPSTQKELNLLLITDSDPGTRDALVRGAMAIRACRSLRQGIPVVLPYDLLYKIVDANFQRPHFTSTEKNQLNDTNEFREMAKAACNKIFNDDQWTIYKSDKSNFIALLPKQCVYMLNLKNFTEISHQELKTEIMLIGVGKRYISKKIECDDVIEILSTSTKKNIVWAGHGSKPERIDDKSSMALGFSLQQVSKVINQSRNINFWDLHSCYLLGNIKNIMNDVQEQNSQIMVNNGSICASHPSRDDSTLGYFWASSRAIQHGDDKLASKMKKISPLKNSCNIENHPHLIHKNSRQIIPITFPGIVDIISHAEMHGKPIDCKYLVIDRLIVKDPLHLIGQVNLLLGPTELNSHHLCAEVCTTLTFSEFARSAFERRGYNNTLISYGNTLLMIGKLICADGIYEQLILTNGAQEKYNSTISFTCLVKKEDKWYSFDKNSNSTSRILKQIDSVDINHFMEESLQASRPSASSFVDNQVDVQTFNESVREMFHLPENCFKPVSDEIQIDLFKAYISSPSSDCIKKEDFEWGDLYACRSDEWQMAFFKAITLQNVEEISSLYLDSIQQKNIDEILINAMAFCIERNLFEAFSHLLKLASNKLDEAAKDELIKICIEMNRIELLELFDRYPENSLAIAAEWGTPALFEMLWNHMNRQPIIGQTSLKGSMQANRNEVRFSISITINYKDLLSMAANNENWEMSYYLTSNKENFQNYSYQYLLYL